MYLCHQMLVMRVRLLEDILSKKRKVEEVAEILWVTRKTVHKWKCRYTYYGVEWLVPKKPWPKRWTTWNRTANEIEKVVAKYAIEHKTLWPQRLSVKLVEHEWIKLDQSTIYRILKRRKIRYYKLYERPKKKKKLYVLDKPWRELQVDTSFPFGYHRKFVIYTAIDDCTRMVYAQAYERHTIDSTKKFMKELLKRCPFDVERIRTDQWREFSKTITAWLEERNIQHIKNEPYHPEHNGKVERYHRTMKEEEVSKWPYLIEIPEANYRLRQRTSYYNYERGHTGLWMNGSTPMKRVESFLKNVTLILQ